MRLKIWMFRYLPKIDPKAISVFLIRNAPMVRLIFIIATLLPVYAVADERSATLQFTVTQPTPFEERLFGASWHIFAEGVIDADADKRLRALIKARGIPYRSSLFLNSPGGSVVAGLALGRTAREYNFITYVGAQPPNRQERTPPGLCASSCSLAFLGGSYRFITAGSVYGVHRFSGPPSPYDSDVAQILTAEIAKYIKEMGIDVELLTLMANTASADLQVISEDKLKALKVTYSGHSEAAWTAESKAGMVYLKGQQETYRGVDKFMVMCSSELGGPAVIAMFNFSDETAFNMMAVHWLMVDRDRLPIRLIKSELNHGNEVVAMYPLAAPHIAAMRTAQKIGITMQGAADAPVFIGFADMATTGMAEKLDGILGLCPIQPPIQAGRARR